MTKIPKSFQDYDDNDLNINFRKNRWDYWAALKKARKDYLKDIGELDGQFDAFEFDNWLANNYGLKINVTDTTGNITDSYVVIDEKKYLIFLLKYS
jgi:hypothetical protein